MKEYPGYTYYELTQMLPEEQQEAAILREEADFFRSQAIAAFGRGDNESFKNYVDIHIDADADALDAEIEACHTEAHIMDMDRNKGNRFAEFVELFGMISDEIEPKFGRLALISDTPGLYTSILEKLELILPKNHVESEADLIIENSHNNSQSFIRKYMLKKEVNVSENLLSHSDKTNLSKEDSFKRYIDEILKNPPTDDTI
jgi:hypothetical protein